MMSTASTFNAEPPQPEMTRPSITIPIDFPDPTKALLLVG